MRNYPDMRLSKSKFVAGIQCPKRLYLQVHNPELAAAPTEAQMAIMQQGHEVGRLARKAFNGGVLVDAHSLVDAIGTTRELVTNPRITAIFEATFEHDDVLVKVDVLQRRSDGSFRLVEVKSSTDVKDHYIYDVGIQKHVTAATGLNIENISLMHINGDYVFPGGPYELGQLFTTADLTADVAIEQAKIPATLSEQFHILAQSEPPEMKPGRQCRFPVRCEFFDYCNPERPEDDVSRLPRITAKKIEQLAEIGVTSIRDISHAR